MTELWKIKKFYSFYISVILPWYWPLPNTNGQWSLISSVYMFVVTRFIARAKTARKRVIIIIILLANVLKLYLEIIVIKTCGEKWWISAIDSDFFIIIIIIVFFIIIIFSFLVLTIISSLFYCSHYGPVMLTIQIKIIVLVVEFNPISNSFHCSFIYTIGYLQNAMSLNR